MEGAQLSAAAQKVWAKSSYDEESATRLWMPLWLHLLDTAAVADRLVDEWAMPSLQGLVEKEFLGSTSGLDPVEEFRLLACWIAGLHDLGKASPAFQAKDRELDGRVREVGMRHSLLTPDMCRELPHGLAGQLAFEEILEHRGWRGYSSGSFRKGLGSVIGAHHGVPNASTEVEAAMGRSDLLGRDEWETVREELFNLLTERAGVENLLPLWAQQRWSQAFLVALSGLVIVADWLASCADYFPLLHQGDDGLEFFAIESHVRRAARAWEAIEFPVPWCAHDHGASSGELLASRFSLPVGSRPSAMQTAAIEAARDIDGPGLLILQDSTGSGKTEAALMAAEILAARSGKSGILFALPTQTTTDAMFSRQLDWLGKIGEDYGPDEAPDFYNTQLVHGRNRLNAEARRLRRRGHTLHEQFLGSLAQGFEDTGALPQGIYGDGNNLTPPAAIAPWFNGRKRTMLADFVTCTVDHLLFAALKSPHLAVRHLGLARKVVVIDEVHSYSSYMNEYLEMALTWLAAYEVPVVLLSATLSNERCAALVNAYHKGLEPQSVSNELIDVPFPALVTHSREGTYVKACPAGRTATFQVLHLTEKLPDLLRAQLSDGGCALVVRNTVRRAQETYAELREVFGDDVTLHHSRFTVGDRLSKDAELLRNFGPPHQEAQRPYRAIVVATQVVEQSLDLDFDILVTDLAPIDLILQRAGRLHRHTRPRPRRLADPRCYIDCLPRPYAEPHLEHGAAAIYWTSNLLRTASVLNQVMRNGSWIEVPRDIRGLMESVYGPETSLPSAWQTDYAEASELDHQRAEDARQEARVFRLSEPRNENRGLAGWLDLHNDLGEQRARAVVRDGEDTLEVILVESTRDGSLETLRTLPNPDGCPGRILPTDRVPDWEAIEALARSAVRLSHRFTGQRLDQAIAELENQCIEAWQNNAILRGQLILPMTDGRATLAGTILEYSPREGMKEATSQ